MTIPVRLYVNIVEKEKMPPRRKPAVKPPLVVPEFERISVKNVVGEIIAYDYADPRTGLIIPGKREWIKKP